MAERANFKQAAVDRAELERWMKAALRAAQEGVAGAENPFGAAIYRSTGEQISLACNTVVSTHNPSAHAEVNAIAGASAFLQQQNLSGLWLVATAEPCPMCLSAAAIAGIGLIAFGAGQDAVSEAGFGDLGISARQLAGRFSTSPTLHGSILEAECVAFLMANRKPS